MSISGGIKALAAAGVLSIGLSSNGMAQMAYPTDSVIIETVTVTAYRTKDPANAPAAKSETKGAAPSAEAKWVPGFWDFQGKPTTAPRAGWAWIPGQWQTPPAQDARWDPAHWGWANDWWSWIPGHWVQPGPDGFPPSLQADEMSQSEISQ